MKERLRLTENCLPLPLPLNSLKMASTPRKENAGFVGRLDEVPAAEARPSVRAAPPHAAPGPRIPPRTSPAALPPVRLLLAGLLLCRTPLPMPAKWGIRRVQRVMLNFPGRMHPASNHPSPTTMHCVPRARAVSIFFTSMLNSRSAGLGGVDFW